MKGTMGVIAAIATAMMFVIPPVMAEGNNEEGAAPTATSPVTSTGPRGGQGMMPRMGAGMSREEMRRMGRMRGPRRQVGGGMMRNPMMMRMLFIAIDADGSRTLSLSEVLDFHERMFKVADIDGDGELTQAEMRSFMQSGLGN